MSDYLSRAVASISSGSDGVRPKLPSLFDPPTAVENPAFIEVSETRPQIVASDKSSTFQERLATSAGHSRQTKSTRETVLEGDAPSSPPSTEPRSPLTIRVVPPAPTSPNEPSAESPTPSLANIVRAAHRESLPPASSRAEAKPAPKSPPEPAVVLQLREPMPVRARVAPKPNAPAIATADPSPPVIQITIGRVEVRALPPPAAVKPRSPRPGPRVSLDAYLRSRNGTTA